VQTQRRICMGCLLRARSCKPLGIKAVLHGMSGQRPGRCKRDIAVRSLHATSDENSSKNRSIQHTKRRWRSGQSPGRALDAKDNRWMSHLDRGLACGVFKQVAVRSQGLPARSASDLRLRQVPSQDQVAMRGAAWHSWRRSRRLQYHPTERCIASNGSCGVDVRAVRGCKRHGLNSGRH